jgi:hypothetical protein
MFILRLCRGQNMWELPSPASHPMFFASALGVCLIHAGVMIARYVCVDAT